MNPDDFIAALGLPDKSRLDKRVPKKLLVENGAPTTGDKRQINDGVEELRWIASLKPTTIGVPHFANETREYLEIAVLLLLLRAKAKAGRLNELVHRAIPYPVLLFTSQAQDLNFSVAHKRWSLGEAGKVVLDGDVIHTNLDGELDPEIIQAFRESLLMARQKRNSLYTLYQSWTGCIVALAAARITGRFLLPGTAKRLATMQGAVEEHDRIDREIGLLRAQAKKEKQTSRRVELNLEIKRLETAGVSKENLLGDGGPE